MTPDRITAVRQQLEDIASSNRRPLPTQDTIADDLTTLAAALEQLVEEISPQATGEYSAADIWAVIALIAQAKVKELAV